MKSEKLIWNSGFARLEETLDGQQILRVLCGSVAMGQRAIVLNDEEKRMIEEWGVDYYAEKLALDIAKEPALFEGRFIVRDV